MNSNNWKKSTIKGPNCEQKEQPVIMMATEFPAIMKVLGVVGKEGDVMPPPLPRQGTQDQH